MIKFNISFLRSSRTSSFPLHRNLVFILILIFPVTSYACSTSSGGPFFIGVYLILLFIPIIFIELYALWRLLPRSCSLMRLGLLSFGMNLMSTFIGFIFSIVIGIAFSFMDSNLNPIEGAIDHEVHSFLTLIPLYFICVKSETSIAKGVLNDVDTEQVKLAVSSANFHTMFMLGAFIIARIVKISVTGTPLMI